MANGKKKGNRAERSAAKVLEDWTGKNFTRVPTSGGLRWHKTDGVVGDITCSTEGHYFPFTVEVKFHEKIEFSQVLFKDKKQVKLRDFYNQVMEDSSRASKQPLLMIRYNGMPKDIFYVGMKRKLFIEFCSRRKRRTIPHIYISIFSMVFFTSDHLSKLPYKDIHTKFRIE